MTLVADPADPETTHRGIVTLERATMEGVDFRKASFAQFQSTGCVFVRCDFRGLTFDARLQTLFVSRIQSVFRECRFDDADLRKASPGQAFAEDRLDPAHEERLETGIEGQAAEVAAHEHTTGRLELCEGRLPEVDPLHRRALERDDAPVGGLGVSRVGDEGHASHNV